MKIIGIIEFEKITITVLLSNIINHVTSLNDNSNIMWKWQI